MLPVRAVPITTSPFLAQAAGQLAALQVNLPRPRALENAVSNLITKNDNGVFQEENHGDIDVVDLKGCDITLDLSVVSVSELHFFVENNSFNPSRLIYSIKNNGRSLADFPYEFHSVWYVQTQVGQDSNSISGKQYPCTTKADGTMSCTAPDWRDSFFARMNIYSDDPACPLPLDVFVFGNGYAFPKEQKANLCTPFSLGSPEVSVPTNLEAGVKKEVDFCFNTKQDLPPKTGFYDDFIMDVTIGNVSSTVFPFRENNRRICYAYKDYSGAIKEKTPFKWSVYDFRCWNVAIAGNISIDGSVAAVTVQGASGDNGQDTEEQICQMAPLIDTASAKFIRNYNHDNTEYYIYSFTFKLKSKVPLWNDETNRYVITPEINKPGYSAGYDHCVLDATRAQLVCSNLVFAQNYPGIYYVEFWNTSGSTLLCQKTVYTGSVLFPGITPSVVIPSEQCSAINNSLRGISEPVVIGWQKNEFVFYYKIPGGVPGLTKALPSGVSSLIYRVDEHLPSIANATCKVISGFDDRLYCYFGTDLAAYSGTRINISLLANSCTIMSGQIYVPPLDLGVTPTPTWTPDMGCGPEPVTDSTDPAVVKKYHKWCTCKGGSWTSYPDGSGECSVH